MNTHFKRIFRHLPQRIRVWMIEQGWLNDGVVKLTDVPHWPSHSLPVVNPKSWTRRFRKVLKFNPSLLPMVDAFCRDDLHIVKTIKIPADALVLICLQKNDLVRIKAFIDHHRSLGIRHYAIIDNGSTDGSREWLMEQPDVFLFATDVPYTSANRDAWINRVLAYFGDNRWYLVLDSDELLAYDDMERRDIGQLIARLEQKHILRCRAMMLDMYATDGYFEIGDRADFLKQCVFFDVDTYTTGTWDYHVALSGGPRKRLFGTDATLTKYPLFRLAEGELLYQAHAMFPLRKNLNTPCHLVLRHYKFLPGDKQKFESIAREGKYFGGSIEYKNYIKAMSDAKVVHFVDGASAKYEDSASLRSIPCYNPIDW